MGFIGGLPSVHAEPGTSASGFVKKAGVEAANIIRQQSEVAHHPTRQAGEHFPVVPLNEEAAPPAGRAIGIRLAGNAVDVLASQLGRPLVARVGLLAQSDHGYDQLSCGGSLKAPLVPPGVRELVNRCLLLSSEQIHELAVGPPEASSAGGAGIADPNGNATALKPVPCCGLDWNLRQGRMDLDHGIGSSLTLSRWRFYQTPAVVSPSTPAASFD